ncbi:MAG: ribonuclease D [Anaerolineales bacterium]|nr:ribonuclease D [Chloroflexota bacterium]MBL6981485.1 ribonuclease D [Anaerolineales bacterium]
MRLDELPDPIFIARPNALRRLVEELSSESHIAVDTEANGLYAYREQVCLIQFSTPTTDYLVDTLALDDLSPLAAVFENPNIEKVFHASEYDLIILHQDFEFSVVSLFDTMIAARILGWNAVGLGSILEDLFDIRVNKKYQRANWGQRPISKEMMNYAQIDTHFLLPLRDQIELELKESGRWPLAVEDFLRCSQVDSLNHRNGNGDCFRIKGAHDLKPQRAAVLRELCIFRDRKARSMDRPLFKVIGDKSLLEIAEKAPKSNKELEKIRGISKRQVNWLGEGLLASVKRGLAAKPLAPVRKPRPNYQYLNRVDQLRSWRIRKAQSFGVMSDVVMPKDLLLDLAEKNPGSKSELNLILESVPWRLGEFGDELLSLLGSSKK